MKIELFAILNSNISVKNLLGSSPLRVFPYSRAPQEPAKPYVTYNVYNGVPGNYMDKVPDIDNAGTQIDIFAEDDSTCQQCFDAIRDALEPYAHMTGFSTPALDSETNLYSARQEFDFWTAR